MCKKCGVVEGEYTTLTPIMCDESIGVDLCESCKREWQKFIEIDRGLFRSNARQIENFEVCVHVMPRSVEVAEEVNKNFLSLLEKRDALSDIITSKANRWLNEDNLS